MLFNSIDFGIFLPLVFLCYWFVFNKNIQARNIFLIGVSYLFYGWWDWRFLSLIIISSLADFFIGNQIGKSDKKQQRKRLLVLSIFINLGVLVYFKYANFFVENFVDAFQFFGIGFTYSSLDIILPVGISFYTFQTMSYTVDIYRGKLKADKDWTSFFAFVSFFPQLVAGPIERAVDLLPQFKYRKKFDYAYARIGLQQALWGTFKKVVIADNCAYYANQIFDNYADFSGSTLVVGAVLFAFQIYGDFSGYSDIAIGISKMFGFKLRDNFKLPYFSRDIAEFWRRWHISLSTWFRDYLYIPLGGSQRGTTRSIINVFVIFLVSGFWHGANWTFVVWGGLNAVYFLPLLLAGKNRKNTDNFDTQLIPSLKDVLKIGFTFGLTVIAWVFFRAEDMHHAIFYLRNIADISLLSVPSIFPLKIFFFIFVMVIIEWVQRTKVTPLEIPETKFVKPVRWLIYFMLVFLIFAYGDSQEEFIYFRF